MSENAFRTALVAIIEGDGPAAGTIQALCGRSQDMVRDWDTLAASVLPVITYFHVTVPEVRGSANHQEVLVQLDCWADGASGGIDTVERLADRLEAILTWTNFNAQGVDAAPLRRVRADDNDVGEDAVGRGRQRKRLEMYFDLAN